ncbi:metal ABC transporter permease [Arthrobacter woluwensis]|uniref:Zinc/manganese transport system permease protein n=1 Tax=Arthrobacter woluwensis TaxID=156980 RepID=A0A1H4N2P8_9MICC|nr:metal ABC transporter permease [Arthrobacter woluwensis]SEB89549.1 zinc/manganese transport system permease protein [Arthrobacter woluwensis]
MDFNSVLSAIFNFENYGELLALLQNSLWAGAVLGVLGGLVGVFVVKRDLSFAVHGISELSFAGASFALLIGADVVFGSLLGSVAAALLLGVMGLRAREKNSLIGVLMPFGLGLGILFLSLYEGRAANKFSLLTGQIVSVDAVQLQMLAVTAALVMVALVVLWRPLNFASDDPEVAEARGVPVKGLSMAFMLILGVSVALSIQVVGALLVLALLITPAAAAFKVTGSPALVVLLSVVFATTSTVGGILLALAGRIPISPYVTTISFLIYLVCWGIGSWRKRKGRNGRRVEVEARA